jgi:ABC-type lipoprotein release transport system permease subunit
LILGGATLIVVGIALLATSIPAYRSARLDPAKVLRPDWNRQGKLVMGNW